MNGKEAKSNGKGATSQPSALAVTRLSSGKRKAPSEEDSDESSRSECFLVPGEEANRQIDHASIENNGSRLVQAHDGSITQRYRRRVELAKSLKDDEAKETEFKHWFCCHDDCNRTISAGELICQSITCRSYRELIESKDILATSREELRRAQTVLEQSQKSLRAQRLELETCRANLAKTSHKTNEQGETSTQYELEMIEQLKKLQEQAFQHQQSMVQKDETIVQKDESAVQMHESAVQMHESAVHDKETILIERCEAISGAHERMKEILIHGKNAGNKTDHKTQYTNAPKEVQGTANVEARTTAMDGKRDQSPSKIHQALVHADDEITVDEIPDRHRGKLEEFYLYCNDLFARSIPVDPSKSPYKSPGYQECIRTTCKAIAAWTPGTEVNASSARYYRPSAVAEEANGVHPILLAIMWKVNDLLGCGVHLTSEQQLPQTKEKSKRSIDAMWSECAHQFLNAADGNLIGKVAEFKPVSRQTESWAKLQTQGGNQVLGHMFQILWDSCFQFCGGLGRDGSAHGGVFTMISAQLFSSELTGVGTLCIDVKVRKMAKPAPLFSRATTENLIVESKINVDKLGFGFAKDREMQPGFKALVHFVRNKGLREQQQVFVSRREDAGFPPNDSGEHFVEIEGDKFKIGVHLGSGAFCSVFTAENKERKNVILKIGKSSKFSQTSLKNELTALSKLKHDSIPKLFTKSIITFAVKQRCERTCCTCLVLDMKQGLPLDKVCKMDSLTKPAIVEGVLRDVLSALKYAHGKKWYHLDVQPSNIVLVESEGDPKFVLIDWGTAATADEGKIPYRGTPPFSHPSFLRIYQAEGATPSRRETTLPPEPIFDKYSLALTVCYILAGRVAWDGFHGDVVTKDILNDREKTARAILDNQHSSVREGDLVAVRKILEATSF